MLWRWLGLVFVLSFGALGYLGWQIYLTAPPIPKVVASASGQVLFTGEQIEHGQQVWLASGGQQQGSVWGHGAYVAPDWSADWLHREALSLRALRAKALAADPAHLSAAEQGAVDGALKDEMRRNTYDAATGKVTVSDLRARAIGEVAAHYMDVFGNAASASHLREQYAMRDDVVPDAKDRQDLTAFFFWSAWSAVTDRPNETGLSYTSNWPHEPLVGNTMPTSAALRISAMTSGLSVDTPWKRVCTLMPRSPSSLAMRATSSTPAAPCSGSAMPTAAGKRSGWASR